MTGINYGTACLGHAKQLSSHYVKQVHGVLLGKLPRECTNLCTAGRGNKNSRVCIEEGYGISQMLLQSNEVYLNVVRPSVQCLQKSVPRYVHVFFASTLPTRSTTEVGTVQSVWRRKKI